MIEVKPKFIFKDNFLLELFRALIFLIVYSLILNEFKTYKEYPIILLIYIVIIFTFVLVKCLIIKKHYRRYAYRFYSDRLEYIDNYHLKKEKVINYEDIKSITMCQNDSDKKIGFIRINLYNQSYISTLKMEDIENRFDKIKKKMRK